MSYRDIEIMISQGTPEDDARRIDNLSGGFLEETFAFGLSEFHVIRSLRAAYDLGLERAKKGLHD